MNRHKFCFGTRIGYQQTQEFYHNHTTGMSKWRGQYWSVVEYSSSREVETVMLARTHTDGPFRFDRDTIGIVRSKIFHDTATGIVVPTGNK